jgi:hypothetical protein
MDGGDGGEAKDFGSVANFHVQAFSGMISLSHPGEPRESEHGEL